MEARTLANVYYQREARTSREDQRKSRLKAAQVELVKLQRHVIETGQKVLVIVEGRDAAGKDGTSTRLQTATVRHGISSGMSSTFRSPARSSCSIAVGTTAAESSASWSFARKRNTIRFSRPLRFSRSFWYIAASPS